MRSCFFFFSSRRRHTRLQGDWSSDVCSSDLAVRVSCARVVMGVGSRKGASKLCIIAQVRKRRGAGGVAVLPRSEEHTSELQSPCNLVCRLLLEKKKMPGEAPPHRTLVRRRSR